MNRHASAFSLVELSIVLVILGLLTGGILAGQSLIRAAELRSVSTEYQRYVAATQAFRDKYFATPGDFTSATRFWGRLNGNGDCVTNSGAVPAAPGACDGNGNGTISGPGAAAQSGESFQYWRQLALGGLIEGTYTGLSGAGGANDSTLGTNLPRSKLNNSGWFIESVGNFPGDTITYAANYGDINFVFGAAIANERPYAQALKPEEAWNIDTKLDDGKPARGKVIAMFWNNACAIADDGSHANNDLAASYKLSENSNQCALKFLF